MSAGPTVVVARVEALFGVRGWVRLRSYTRPPDNLLRFRHFSLGEGAPRRELRLAEMAPHGKGFIARFEDVADRDAAAALVGLELAVSRAELPPPGPETFYWSDLIGFEVRGRDDEALGTLTGFIETAAHDVMVVSAEGRERLIPYVRGVYVQHVDVGARRIEVDWSSDFDA